MDIPVLADESGAETARRRAAERALLGAAVATPGIVVLPLFGYGAPRGTISTAGAFLLTGAFVHLRHRCRSGERLEPLLRAAWLVGYLAFAVISVETPLVVDDRQWAVRYSTEMQISVVVVAAAGYLAMPLRQARLASALTLATAVACLVEFELVWGGALPSLHVLVLAGVAIMLVDVHSAATAEMAAAEAAARARAFFADVDPLTGLLNRRGLESVVAEHWPVSLLLLDLDRFKRINDVHGHAAGDETLVAVAASLRAVLREQDVVGRWGGEEFLVLARTTAAAAVAGRLHRAVAAADTPVPVTVSIGVARPTVEGDTFEQVLRRADEALYRAKDAGRDGIVLAAPDGEG